MPLANHVNPDHFLDLEHAVHVGRDDVAAAWELAYSILETKLRVLGEAGTLYLVCGLQGAGKTTWIERNASRFGHTAVFLDGALPSRRHRARALGLAREAGCKAVAVWVNTPLEVSMAQNAMRAGLARIREETIRHVHEQLEPPSFEEGFAGVIEVTSGNSAGTTGRAGAILEEN